VFWHKVLGDIIHFVLGYDRQDGRRRSRVAGGILSLGLMEHL